MCQELWINQAMYSGVLGLATFFTGILIYKNVIGKKTNDSIDAVGKQKLATG